MKFEKKYFTNLVVVLHVFILLLLFSCAPLTNIYIALRPSKVNLILNMALWLKRLGTPEIEYWSEITSMKNFTTAILNEQSVYLLPESTVSVRVHT